MHIAGTKGKGSTSAFVSWILAQYLPSPSQPKPLFKKIGLYTSPHLRFVRERIQINNEPLTEQAFAKYFFEVWDRLEDSARRKGEPTDSTAKPVYFRFLTLMAFHTYISEDVDIAIIECGIGGEYDSTNIIVSPTTTGITSLGIDHTAILGNSIEEIAWHKAGIMKPNAPCFTAPQPSTALSVLQERAKVVPTTLTVTEPHPLISHIKLGLAAPFQLTNASLAIALTSSHLASLNHADRAVRPGGGLPSEFVHGLEATRWPGRCEVRIEGNILWHIDSGHTLESIEVAASWFASQVSPLELGKNERMTRILLFNQQTRDANALARALHNTLATALEEERPFTHVVFCTNVTFKESGFRPDLQSMNTDAAAVQSLEVQNGLAETWKGIDPEANVKVVGSIEEAVEWCRGVVKKQGDEEVMVLVTGSVHLVGGFLEVLEETPTTGSTDASKQSQE